MSVEEIPGRDAHPGPDLIGDLWAKGDLVPNELLTEAVAERDALAAQVAAVEVLQVQVAAGVEQLTLLASQVRKQGDIPQVALTEDGVDDAPSLANELWLIAYNLHAALAKS